MNKPRYVKTMQQLIEQAENQEQNKVLPSTVSQVVIDYETLPELAAAILPPPLKPKGDGLIRIVLSQVAMHVSDSFSMNIGSGVFGVHCSFDNKPGYYVVTMPMTAEAAVIGGREIFGEPKKIADIPFVKTDNQIMSSISRHGKTYIDVKGQIGDELPPKIIEDKAFVFKVFPSITGQGLEYEPLLMQLNLTRKQKQCFSLDAELTLNDSPLDPVADLPVNRIVSAVYEITQAESSGELLATATAEDLYPYLHQRYDDFAALMAET